MTAVVMRIAHRGDRWYVESEDGKPLGDYATEAEAKERLRQVEIHKHSLARDPSVASQPSVCPTCGSSKIGIANSPSGGAPTWVCQECGEKFAWEDGAARRQAMATAEGALHHDELLGGRKEGLRVVTVPAWRFSVSTGRWDQFAKLGEFEKDGARVVFDERTLAEIVENFGGRRNDIGMDYEHQALNAPLNGQPAPALAWYSALALVISGKVREFATHDPAVPQPDGTGLEDGLYGYRARITPLGERLLPNYQFVSPAFTTDGVDEQGKPIGYDLLNIAATNTPFLDGMAPIEMRKIAMAEPMVPCPLCGGTGMEQTQEQSGRGRGVRCRACNGDREVSEARAEAIKRSFPEWKQRLLTRMTARNVSPGARVRVTQDHRDQHGNRLRAGQTGTVQEVSESGGSLESYLVRWDDGKETWVWTRHEPPVERMAHAARMVRADIKIERTGDGRWRVFVDEPDGFRVVGVYASEAEAKRAAEEAPSRGFRAMAVARGSLKSGDSIEYTDRSGTVRRGRIISPPDAGADVGAIWVVRNDDPDKDDLIGWDDVVRKLDRRGPGLQAMARTSGYVYRLEGGSNWQTAPDDDWETVVAEVDGQVVGRRQIDGSAVIVIEAGGRFFAALPQNVSMGRKTARRLSFVKRTIRDVRQELFDIRDQDGEHVRVSVDGAKFEGTVRDVRQRLTFERRDQDVEHEIEVQYFAKEKSPMDPKTVMTRLGLAEGTPVAEKLAKFAQHFASGDATLEDVKAMAEHLEEKHADDEEAQKMAGRFKRFAEGGAVDPAALMGKLGLAEGSPVEEKLAKFAHHFASGEATPGEMKAMAEHLEEKHADHEDAQKMARHFKRFAETTPFAAEETPEEEAKERAALAAMARSLGLSRHARPSEIAVAFSAKTAPLTTVADLQGKVARLEEQLAARTAAETTARAQAFARQAVTDGRTTADKAKLIEETFVGGGEKAAEALLFQKGTFTVMRRYTAGGEVPGKQSPPLSTSDAQPEPDDIRGRMAAKATEIMEAARKAGTPVAYGVAMTRIRQVDPELYAAYAALGTPTR